MSATCKACGVDLIDGSELCAACWIKRERRRAWVANPVMDATACVAGMRRLAHKIASTTDGTFQDAIDLAEAFCDLDESLRKGGALPGQWKAVR